MIIDADSHFVEPFDLFQRYVEPQYRERVLQLAKDPAGGSLPIVVVDGQPMVGMDFDNLFSTMVGHGKKEDGQTLDEFDPQHAFDPSWQDMDARVRYLDAEGIDAQIIYPTLGILWEGTINDPKLADAHCRAYNTWAHEACAVNRKRLHPVAHISLRDPDLAVRELHRVAKLGYRTIFVGAIPLEGRSFGHPEYDKVWAAAQDLDLGVGIHLVVHDKILGADWHRDPPAGHMYIAFCLFQDQRMALTTMVYDGVLERFPKLRVATIESKAGWVGEWLERLDYFWSYMAHTSGMKRPAREYFERNIWIQGDPAERMLPLVVQFAGDDKFFIGSDYPHSEGTAHVVARGREVLAGLPAESVDKVLGRNAQAFFRV
ncbi:MAG: amidohydrolase family protein [Candidatus Binatia bacterium]